MSTIGRNDPCYCGSGKKYNKCHWEADRREESQQRESQVDFNVLEGVSDIHELSELLKNMSQTATGADKKKLEELIAKIKPLTDFTNH